MVKLDSVHFFCKTIAERSFSAIRQSVKEREYSCLVYVRMDNLARVVISDHEYPSRVTHTLITKILDELSQKILLQTGQLSKKRMSISHN